MYSIKYHKRVAKFINSRTPKDKKHIKQKMDKIKQNPYPTNASADIKKLKNRVGFRLRVGNYRFIYEVAENELIIYMENGDNRGDVY